MSFSSPTLREALGCEESPDALERPALPHNRTVENADPARSEVDMSYARENHGRVLRRLVLEAEHFATFRMTPT